MSLVITIESHADGVVTLSIPYDADPAVTDFRLYRSDTADTTSAFIPVALIPNVEAPAASGKVTVAIDDNDFHLKSQSKSFFVRATSIRADAESNLRLSPTTIVEPADSQTYEPDEIDRGPEEIHLAAHLAYNTTLGRYVPISAVDNGSGGYALESTASISGPVDVDINVPPIVYQAPAFSTVGDSSTSIVGANPDRKYMVITNDSSVDMWIAVGSAAVVGSGIYLVAGGGSFEMNSSAGNVSLQEVFAIHADAGQSHNITVQEGEAV
jgi:hypothetical protein